VSYFSQVSHHLTVFQGQDWERLGSKQARSSKDARKGNFQWSKGSYLLLGFLVGSMYCFRWIISQRSQNRNCAGYRMGQKVTIENLFWLLQGLGCAIAASTCMVPKWSLQPAAKSQEQREE